MRALLPLLAVASLLGAVSPAGSVAPVSLDPRCGMEDVVYCAISSIEGLDLGCVAAGDGYDCTIKARYRGYALSQAALPGQGNMLVDTEVQVCVGPGPCGLELASTRNVCTWDMLEGGCALHHEVLHTHHVATGGQCFFYFFWSQVHTSARAPGFPRAVASDDANDADEFTADC